MFTDINGDIRYKVGLHVHTTNSDGRATPEESAKLYKEAGYDMIAFTDHWHFGKGGSVEGINVMSGAEYNIGGREAANGVYHIVALGCETEPNLQKTDCAQTIVDEINRCGGMAVLAHPAWSLNNAYDAAKIKGFGATEIYNTVSGKHFSSRPYSGDFVDTSAVIGVAYNLLATDDAHYYDNDMCYSATYVKAKSADPKDILEALKAGDFYCGAGPQVFLTQEGNICRVRCSESVDVRAYSNIVFARGRRYSGEPVTEFTFELTPDDRFVRAEVTDANGNVGYTSVLEIDRSFINQ
jgi:hypothetical protein